MKTLLSILFVLMLYAGKAQELTFAQKRVIKLYQKGSNERCIKLSYRLIKSGKSGHEVNYCYALSLFNTLGEKINTNELDKILHYLKYANPINNNSISFLTKKDSLTLLNIKCKSEDMAYKEWEKNKKKVIKRLLTMIKIYQDTSMLYHDYLAELQKKDNKINKLKIIDITPTYTELLSSKLILEAEQALNLYFTSSASKEKDLVSFLKEKTSIIIAPSQELIINKAATQYGLSEFNGKQHNPEIMKYFKDLGYAFVKNDETSWCSAFISWCAKNTGLPYPSNLMARAWLEMGKKVTEPQTGDIIVLWRENKNSWQGHVAFYVSSEPSTNMVYCYGGNQDGKVCIRPYPIQQVLAYRRLE